ncbi:MAG: N-acetylmuramoyl-L-alanine amidase [Gaiellales bacterium]
MNVRKAILIGVVAAIGVAAGVGFSKDMNNATLFDSTSTTQTQQPSSKAHPATSNATAPATQPPTSASSSDPTTTSPTSTARPATGPALPLAGKVIVVDPGHNVRNRYHAAEINRPVQYGLGPGSTKPCDTTGTATAGGYSEAQYNLSVARMVVAILRKRGARVAMTPVTSRPWGPCITARAALGNRLHAAAAVSIHADGAPSPDHGFYVIVPSAPIAYSGLTAAMIHRDRLLGAALLRSFHTATGMPISNQYPSGYLASDAYGGTNLSHIPRVFIETGNMPNPGDAARFQSAGFRRLAALGIANGITAFVRRR